MVTKNLKEECKYPTRANNQIGRSMNAGCAKGRAQMPGLPAFWLIYVGNIPDQIQCYIIPGSGPVSIQI